MLNIVLDANILVSAFLTPAGESAHVLRQAQSQKLYLSPFILSEVWQTLHYDRIRTKYQYSESDIDQYLTELGDSGTLLEPLIVLDACSDPKDNAVLACAAAAKAAHLVTRNIKHFPKEYQGVKVIHPREFLETQRPQ